MAKQLACLTPRLIEFINAQHIFFVSTAPLASSGNVNVSPKGLDSFRILGKSHVSYLDLTGSGNETAAHLTENGRITLMFCSFTAKPLIIRIYGTGNVILPSDPSWDDAYQPFAKIPGERQIIDIQVAFVRTSCGFGVPHMKYEGDRELMEGWATKLGKGGLAAYRRRNNLCSIDGLPSAVVE